MAGSSRRYFVGALLAFALWTSEVRAVDKKETRSVVVNLTAKSSSFTGNLDVSVEGTLGKTKITWVGAITNQGTRMANVWFCIRGFDSTGAPLHDSCILTLTGEKWRAGETLPFKGELKNVPLARGSKTPTTLSRAEIEVGQVTEISDTPQDRSTFFQRNCDQVWSATMLQITQQGFRLQTSDRDGGVITLQQESYTYPQSQSLALQVTGVDPGKLGIWSSFMMTSGQITIAPENAGCRFAAAFQYAGYKQGTFLSNGWYALPSNGTPERMLIESVGGRLAQSASAELSQESTAGPKAAITLAAELSVTSEPPGAEIVSVQEFIGNTPSTWKVKPGSYTITVSKSGYKEWTRIITVGDQDKKTLHAELVKE